jgi:hypothetical protein
MKYIVTVDSSDVEEIFLFPKTVRHDCMAEAIRGVKNQLHGNWYRVKRTPISAGFIVNGECTGSSETLNLKSRQQDTVLYKRQQG